MRRLEMRSGKGDAWKRGLAFLLICVMLVSAMPVHAFAKAEDSTSTEETSGTKETLAPKTGEEEQPTEPTEPTVPTESTEPTAPTEPTEPTEPTAPTVPTEPTAPTVPTEPTEPKDLTNCTAQLALSLEGWWYAVPENKLVVIEEDEIDFSDFVQTPEALEWAGVSLRYEASDALTGDWFTLVLPESFADVQTEEGFVAPQGIDFVLEAQEEPEQGTKLTVSFTSAGTLDGEIPLRFRLSASEAVTLLLQEDANQKNAFVIIPPSVETEQEQPPTTPAPEESNEEAEQEGQFGISKLDEGEGAINTFSIRGKIVFDENLNGTDWRSLLRPLEFDQNIKIVATYTDNNSEEQTVEYLAQDDLPLDAFYWMLTHDGEGGGSFEIANVPDHVTLGDGKVVKVTKYTVSIDTSLPYYQSSSFEVMDMGADQTISTLTMTVKSQALTLAPEVVGDQTQQTFPMQLTFTNPNSEAVAQSSITRTENPTNIQPSKIQVPVGIQFQVVQPPVPGYKLDSTYTVTKQWSEPETQTGKAAGTIEEGIDVTVSTKNYMQNLTYPFSVHWVDNNNPARPTLDESSFQLQYKTGDGEWTDLTTDRLEELGIDNLPSLDASKAALGEYVYRGLPSNDTAGNVLSYRVVAHDVTGYTVSPNETYKEFTYRKTTSFNATIYWLDSDDADGKRPSTSTLPLKLYRRAANGSYEEVAVEPNVTSNGNTWTVLVPNLPCFNDKNQEYDYVLVQGSIDQDGNVIQKPIPLYKTYYDNGSGNYGNDISLCHNGGTIKQRISANVTFTATKVWKDPQTASAQRPKVIVTLWRYSVPEGGDPGIDAMYNQNLAAQVVYRKTTETGTYQDVLLSYQLKNEADEEAITFTSDTVENLPSDFTLPAYDEQGRKYVYFVRETVDSDKYETSYAYQGQTQSQGAPSGGTVINTRREKALINITKVWQCPSNLPDIEGTSIQMTLQIPVTMENGTTEYQDLTVYSSNVGSFDKLTGDALTAAQTLSGFTENIATLDLQFYVNIYDENGHPYDMSQAVVKEIKVLKKDGEGIHEIPVEGDAGTGTFTLNGNQFIAASTYKGNSELADGMQEFQYKETNTITGTRDYTLIKRWEGFTDEELANYASVSFKLERRSSKDGAQYEIVQPPEGQNAWLVTKDAGWQSVLKDLPKYDNQGYQYLYRASEATVRDTDGNPVTPNWYSYYYRTEDSTTVTNYKGTGGGGSVFYINKAWMDNGDTEARKPVTVRVYQKSEVLTALDNKNDDDVISLDSLSHISEHQLSTVNNWFLEVAVSYDITDCLILEYQVGGASDGAKPAEYTVSQLRAAAQAGNDYEVSGTVSNSMRQYQTLVTRAENGMMVNITNTRIGQASLEVTKQWHDEENASGLRPASVQFQVYQDGQPFMPGADSGIGSITCTGASWDPTTGIITVSNAGDTNTASTWSFWLENLPLFSDTGVPHTYNLEEIGDGQLTVAGENQTGTFSYYLSTKGKTIISTNSGTPDLVTYAFSFENTLTGTTAHSVHKSWHDRDSGGHDRPDLYLTLYRYLKSEAAENLDTPVENLTSYEKYTDCEDPLWIVDNAYHWHTKATGLPLYDKEGREYVYRFQETLNNNGVTFYGTYVQEAKYGVTDSCKTCDDMHVAYATPYDMFTNTLTDGMSIRGTKTWTGFDGYQVSPKDYPEVTIELYRSLDPNIDPLNKKDNDPDFQQWRDSGTIQKVDQVVLRYDEETDTYPTTYSFGTEEEKLPKFDEFGRRWYYSIREVIPDDITDSLYTEKFANNTLTNVFREEVNRRSISVTKTWIRPENLPDKYPSVTYTLYRYEAGSSPDSAVKLKEVKISAAAVKNNAEQQVAEGQERTPLCTFTDLLIYSPSGKPYCYYVKEASINGYTISYTDEDGIAEGYSNNGRSDVISIPDGISAPAIAQVGTINTYNDPGQLTITGNKKWNDYGNSGHIYGNRPDSITVTLKRSTQNENGQSNAVTEETIVLASTVTEGEPYILWEKSAESNVWQYTICNLERYAPNGMPYIYSVTETPVEGYKQSSGTVSGMVGASGDLSLNGLTNSLGGSYYVRKNWMDGNNKYGLRPTSITVVLQRSKDGGQTWENILWEKSFGRYDSASGKWTGLPSVTEDKDGNKIVSITLTSAYEIPNTRRNSWQYTFTNLPTQDADGNKWQYRCIETKIGSAPVDDTSDKAGAYTRSYPTQDKNKTVIQNKLESTSLHVAKTWLDDQNDLYHSRPDELTFVLQMRGIVQKDTGDGGLNMESGGEEGEGGSEGEFDLSEWQNVMVNGSPYTFTLRPDKWETILQDLPVAMVGEDGRTYYALYFRAVEQTTDDRKVIGALNYKDETSYELESPDHFYDKQLTRNESKITNRLITEEAKSTITVNKVWQRQPGAEVSATFELLYKTVDETNWHCYDGQTISNPKDLSGHSGAKCVTQTLTSTEAGKDQSVQWTGLPQYDREGKLLVYLVVERPVDGYATEWSSGKDGQTSIVNWFASLFNASADYNTQYSFTNTELQSYTVTKVWQNTDYAQKTEAGFTATFELQQQVEGETDWTPVDEQTLSTTSVNATVSYTWSKLPKYRASDGKQITYRAVETKINGVNVTGDTNGSYIVTYQYGTADSPAFAGTETTATNRMVYGFVNLSKAAAYLAPSVTADENKKLKGVKFDIYAGTGDSKTLYVSNVVTDVNGNLTRNSDGTYGNEKRYLIAGEYTLVETSTNPGYSVWRNGVTFTVGVSGKNNTGEHGTAWISTSGIGELVLRLDATYILVSDTSHTFNDGCVPAPSDGREPAYNLESRGVIRFDKTGPNGKPLDTHAGATGESKAYFGVYTDAACTDQVAGMMADDADGFTMVLTTLAKDGSTDYEDRFLNMKNSDGLLYLRKETNGQLTLLSGSYYLKELVAPPGYKLDTTVHKAIVPLLPSTDIDKDLSTVYSDNLARVEGLDNNEWPNTENQLCLYKRDQYGRIVNLGETGYLELKVQGDGNAFLTGQNTIRLYQDKSTPAKDESGNAFAEGKAPTISYDLDTGSWTIKGLFDIGKTYTLSEPAASVPENNIQAKDFSFTMNPDGSITSVSGDAVAKENPLTVNGNDFKNYYKSDSASNIVVLRDVARYLTDVALEKVDATDSTKKLANISFTLYKYSEVDQNGQPQNPKSVLDNGIYLTTDENGKIQLSKTAAGVKNLVTGCDLRFGLDVGKYYFQEIERGASDGYRLTGKIFFEILPKTPEDGESEDYEDYAKVVFSPTEEVEQSDEDEKTGRVKNTPVTDKPKTLVLTKVDEEAPEKPLAGAEFTLTYTSINDGDPGAQREETYKCETDSDGVLYRRDKDGHITSEKPDISQKGDYVLTETKAPDGYMTRTENGTGSPVTMVTFTVDSDNQIKNVKCYNNGELVEYKIVSDGAQEHTELKLTVKNKKTLVQLAKQNDIEGGVKTSNQKGLGGEALPGAVLEIYEGTSVSDVLVWTSTDSGYTLPAGKLKENTIYTLHEKQAPVGYLAADDICFKLFGTTTKDGQIVSQLYVWTGEGTPALGEDGWSQSSSIQDTVLTMVDEAIIAPVDLQKVVGDPEDPDSGYQALPGAEFEVESLDDNAILGTAVTDDTGHLVWKTVTDPKGLVFDSSGKRITAADASTVINKTIILRQNSNGYRFTETYAPDHAYNDGRRLTAKITDQNYVDYRNGGYQTDVYVDIQAADQKPGNTVDTLTTREDSADENDVVNLPYKSTVTLHKYDADEEANKAPVPGTKFTLYRATVNGGSWSKGDVVGEYTTDESGNLSIEIHKKGYYILEETTAANGYNLDQKNAFPFQLTDDHYNKTTVLKRDEDEIGVPNSRIKGEVTLTKTDEGTREALNGVVYTLSRKSVALPDYLLYTPIEVTTGKLYTAYQNENGSWAWDVTEGDDGVIKVCGLNWGSYTLVEKTELSGYVKPSMPKVFDFEVSSTKSEFSFDDTNAKNQVTFHKTDKPDTGATAKPLAGAVFQVHEGNACGETACTPVMFYDSASATTTVNTVTSGADGTVTIYGLPTDTDTDNPKTYHLVETTAPKGYKLAEPVPFTIARDGTVQVQYQTKDEVPMKDEPIKLYIEKIGENDGTRLSGAEFTLTDVCTDSCDHKLANGSDQEIITITDADGKVMIPVERVIAGHTYMLKETKAPDGYECTAVVTFTVKPDGTADLVSTEGGHKDAVLDETNRTTFTISNEKIRLSLTKVDQDDTETKLEGVTFTLKPAEGSSFVDGNTQIQDGTVTLTTDANGQIAIPEGLVKHDNSYILTESSLTEGQSHYRFPEKEEDRQISFRVEKDGTIAITSSNAMFQLAEGDETALVVSNQQINLTVQKLDQGTGLPLSGVKLKLSRLTTEPDTWTDVEEWTTDGNPKVFKGDTYTPGTYRLEELQAPVGYNTIAGVLTFTIDPAGKISQTAVGGTLSGLTGESWKAKNFSITNPTDGQPGGITLEVANAKYADLQITKQGSDGALLAGVEFKLEYPDGLGKVPVIAATNDNGIATFSGLPDGSYRLTEVKTAQGYNLLSAPLDIRIDRNSETYTVSYNGGTASGGSEGTLTRQGDTLLLTVINQKGLALPATGVTTPQLPKAVLGLTALLEALALYAYQRGGKRRKRRHDG